MKKLNLGCAKDIRKGWVNLDVNPIYKPDVVWDLNKFPYPFKTNVFDIIDCSHILEHFLDVIPLLEELWRIAKPNAKIIIRVPHWSNYLSYSDLTHKKYFSIRSFDYYDWEYYSKKARFKLIKKKYRQNKLSFYKTKTKKFFGAIKQILSFIANFNYGITENFLCKFIPVGDLYFELRVIKEKEQKRLLT